MAFVFDPPETPSVAVAGTDARFPVRRVFCVGRNYAKHAIEMGGDPERDPPFFFSKPADAVVNAAVGDAATVPYPPRTENFHHEIELAIALGRGGTNVAAADALDLVFGYATSVDLTRRDQQAAAKEAGRPWDMSKGFDHSAPIGPIAPAAEVGHPSKGRIWLAVNGETKQNADLQELVWTVPELIANLTTYVTVAPGDVILTGTPAGVGPLVAGDVVTGGVAGLPELSFRIG